MVLPVRYRLDGVARLSVTQVLTLAGRIESQWFTPEAAARGSAVHAWTEAFDRGEEQALPAEWLGYAEAYVRFVAEVRPRFEAIELEVHGDRLDVSGRVDRVCGHLFGGPAVLDIKTGAAADWHGQQLAGYSLMTRKRRRWTLHLRPDGDYRLREHVDPLDYRRFEYDVARAQKRVYPDGDFWRPRG